MHVCIKLIHETSTLIEEAWQLCKRRQYTTLVWMEPFWYGVFSASLIQTGLSPKDGYLDTVMVGIS